ncbi:hypothetical protein N7481_000682 [Penicillium waksmanii]|uniref:uncharacterized protein n=1 Tax=Penicillium waksmanii TaxID=69791 RepID=UPI002546EFF2|nr:uncharacterized protein N7481_000682 [Penicillium waksmanii]KAJ6000273.1 hypothetical protein N7481_000682 [Penicillium waksmanii]
MPHAHHDMALRHTHARREVVPAARLPLLVPSNTIHHAPSLVARAPAAESTGEKPTSNLTTTVLPVVLGAGVPIICAIIVLIFLHRRHVKKLMREDANDKHKSLDFGMDMDAVRGGRRRNGPPGPNGMPQMMEPSHTKGGMSIDMMHPYLMPPGLHGSQDSLHSMGRSIDDDKYRPSAVGAFAAAHPDNRSIRSHSRPPRDDSSSFAGSTSRFGASEEPKSGLLQNAQRMSRSSPPPLYKSPSPDSSTRSHAQSPQDRFGPVPGLNPTPSEHDERGLAIGTASAGHGSGQGQALPYPDSNTASLNFDTDPHSYDTHQDRPNFPLPEPHAEHAQSSTMQLPRISLPSSDVTSDYGDDRHERRSSLMIPAVNVHGAETHGETPGKDNKLPELPEEIPQTLDTHDAHRDTRRLTLGVRPLPPEDPADNPEQRANRIRSFYKEYFDESKRETTYYEDYGAEYYDDGAYAYDPATGDYYDTSAPPPMPFAQPMGRRAMTPPPRAPPRFQGAARHMATNSSGSGYGGYGGYGTPSPRAFSSASGAFGAGPRAPRRPMPPPAPLQDDMFAHEFAPANSIRDRAAGRSETPTGGMRPFSPGMRAHTPLASAFDELSAIPSPHMLRKSGTFTSLDFAPPPRFKNEGGPASDSGSIRSNRTGISNIHQNNVRMGNYRVSRLPPDMVGTKDDLMATLKPDWDMKR